jgi:hypothetical protein
MASFTHRLQGKSPEIHLHCKIAFVTPITFITLITIIRKRDHKRNQMYYRHHGSYKHHGVFDAFLIRGIPSEVHFDTNHHSWRLAIGVASSVTLCVDHSNELITTQEAISAK